jgi:hypothetical protein
VVWQWLVAEDHRPLVTLWFEGYVRSLVEPDGPWVDFARQSVEDWLAVLGRGPTTSYAGSAGHARDPGTV